MTDPDFEMLLDCAVMLACIVVLCVCMWLANWWLGWTFTVLVATLFLYVAAKRFQELDKRDGAKS